MKKNKKITVFLLIFSMALSLMPVNSVKASGEDANTFVSVNIIDRSLVLNEDAKINGESVDDYHIRYMKAKYGEPFEITIISDVDYFLVDDDDVRIAPVSVDEQNNTKTYVLDETYTTKDLTELKIKLAYTLKMPEGIDIIPCNEKGEAIGEPVNSVRLEYHEMFYFKMTDGMPYEFTNSSGLSIGAVNGTDNRLFFAWVTEPANTELSFTLKRLCKASLKTFVEGIEVSFPDYSYVIYNNMVPEDTEFNFDLIFYEMEGESSYDVNDMKVTVGGHELEIPEPEIKLMDDFNYSTNKYKHTYKFVCSGVEDDFEILVDGVYHSGQLTFETFLSRTDIILKDENGKTLTPKDADYNDKLRIYDIMQGRKYLLELENTVDENVRVIDLSNNMLKPISDSENPVYDVTGKKWLVIGGKNEYIINSEILDSDGSVICYDPHYGRENTLSGFYSPDSDGNIYFWIDRDIENPVIYVLDSDGNKTDVTVTRSREMKYVNHRDTRAYVYSVPLSGDMTIKVAKSGEDGNEIVVEPEPPEPVVHIHKYSSWSYDSVYHWKECTEDDWGSDFHGQHTYEEVIDKPATIYEPGTKHEKCTVCGYEDHYFDIPQLYNPIPDVGNNLITENSSASFQVIDRGSESSVPEVVFVKPQKSTAKVVIPAVVKDENGIEYNVKGIEAYAFYNDKKLKNVTIPDSVDTIGKNAFSGCKKLTSVKIGNNVNTIEQNAFAKCTKLKKVEVPKSVTKIGKGAFSGCKKLKTITIKSPNITTVEKNAFKGIDKKATIKVPKKQKKAYTKLLKKAGFKGKIK